MLFIFPRGETLCGRGSLSRKAERRLQFHLLVDFVLVTAAAASAQGGRWEFPEVLTPVLEGSHTLSLKHTHTHTKETRTDWAGLGLVISRSHADTSVYGTTCQTCD